MKKILLIALLLSGFAQADIYQAERLYTKTRNKVASYPLIAQNLVDDSLYFAAIPFIKEYLTHSGAVDKRVENLIDEIISQVGVRQFEALSSKTLASVGLPITKYILAKKYFRSGKHRKSLSYLMGTVPRGHSVEPYALMLKASNLAVMGKNVEAIATYRECVKRSNSQMGRSDDPYQKRQLKINRDYCLVGIPRVEYAMGKFEDAHGHYLDLPKSSYIWPEILFEEAWNSFFMNDYNRVLGKLVTYNAPVLQYLFNPEIEVLQALTYLELCLYKDAGLVVDGFYKKYQRSSKALDILLVKKKKNYRYFYDLAKQKRKGGRIKNSLLNKQMASIIRDASYIEMQEAFLNAEEEFGFVKQMRRSRFKKVVVGNMKQSLTLQRNLIGSYVYKKVRMFQHLMNKAFEGMSYIKLEVLSRRKQQIYQYEVSESGKRGNITNLVRNDRQYFWDFVGEFWADELGDYVFSLKSECK